VCAVLNFYLDHVPNHRILEFKVKNKCVLSLIKLVLATFVLKYEIHRPISSAKPEVFFFLAVSFGIYLF
jgi:hypothetical protein